MKRINMKEETFKRILVFIWGFSLGVIVTVVVVK